MPLPPTPTAILAMRGSWRAKARQKSEAKPPAARPPCPKHLSTAAQVEWRRMTRLLEPAGLLTSIDGDALAIYCATYARWVDAEKMLALDGSILITSNGYKVPHPALAIVQQCTKQMNTMLQQFGMTPASRSRAQVASKGNESDKAKRFFKSGIDDSPMRIARSVVNE